MLKQLSIAQDKLRAINVLTNCIALIPNKQDKNEIAFLIHEIVELDGYINTAIARSILGWQLKSKQDLFVETNQ